MKTKLLLFVSLLILVFLSLDGVKNVLSKEEDKNVKSKEFTIESDISLAPDGDIENNGQIDAGDFVTFTYTIVNSTSNTYKSVTLKTNINRSEFNLINNVQGTINLDYLHNNNITIPYLNIEPNQVRTISFDARINFNKDADQLISTEPELVDDKNNSIFKAQKKDITAKKMDVDSFNKFVHITK